MLTLHLNGIETSDSTTAHIFTVAFISLIHIQITLLLRFEKVTNFWYLRFVSNTIQLKLTSIPCEWYQFQTTHTPKLEIIPWQFEWFIFVQIDAHTRWMAFDCYALNTIAFRKGRPISNGTDNHFFPLIYMNKMYIDGTFDERCIVIAQNKQNHCKVAGFVVAACEFHVRKIELLRIV